MKKITMLTLLLVTVFCFHPFAISQKIKAKYYPSDSTWSEEQKGAVQRSIDVFNAQLKIKYDINIGFAWANLPGPTQGYSSTGWAYDLSMEYGTKKYGISGTDYEIA